MGPIEQSLRNVTRGWPDGSWTWACRCPDAALDFAFGVAGSMGLGLPFAIGRSVDVDVLSEAIEAAEALGL